MKNKNAPLSSAVQDYLKAIYQIRCAAGVVTTTALAAEMGVAAASATNMIKKLAALKLARHSPYRGVELSPAGEKIALEIVRHHRLVEAFLHEALGMSWDEVHDEAHKLEHVLSDNLEDHIADFLGDPTEDPHGDPIPTKAGILGATSHTALADVPIGNSVVVRRITEQNPEHLRHFSDLGLVPNARVTVLEREPFEGPLRVRLENGAARILDGKLARHIWVARHLTAPKQIQKKKTRKIKTTSA